MQIERATMGRLVRQAREEACLSQTTLAFRVGMSQAAISAIESDKVISLKFDLVISIARVTGKPLSFFENAYQNFDNAPTLSTPTQETIV